MGTYSVCMVTVSVQDPDAVKRLVADLVVDVSSAPFAKHIEQYVGGPVFCVDGTTISLMQALVISDEWKPELQEHVQQQELNKADLKVVN